ncbi:MAG: ribonuclease J [Oscillospiraceae bacterium]|nr:ribonuclease J [Oscillospiraceae bacterium]
MPLRVIPLGGLDEIGKNITVYEYENDIVIVDCGMSFPDEDMPGVDIVIPDVSYLVKHKEKIRGLLLTHGHEDHIGAIPYLLKEINVPLYGTGLTLGLVEGKLKEHRLAASAKLNVIKPGDMVTLGCFKAEFIHVNHSIPDAVSIALHTPVGLVLQTGDFKVDTTPIDDDVIDLARFTKLGRDGVLLLLSDSTNADRPGFTMSERKVGESFSALFKNAGKNRILIATFSSNIHRVQQIVDEAVRTGRKVAVSGRSMINTVQISRDLNYLHVPDGVLIDIDMIKRLPPEQLVIITTGSQGEPMSALYRMAFSDHRKVEIIPGDMVIISATPIPGNEKTVSRVINELMKLGANVVYENMYDIHVSGHACQEEQKLMMAMTKPKFFMPVHGEQRHLRKHAVLARQMGILPDNILMGENGRVLELTRHSAKLNGTVQAGRVLVDGLGVGDVGSVVLRDRKLLAEDGLIVAAAGVDTYSAELVAGVQIISRGFVYMKESEQLISEAEETARRALLDALTQSPKDLNAMRLRVKEALSRFIYERTKRSPMILPIVMEI